MPVGGDDAPGDSGFPFPWTNHRPPNRADFAKALDRVGRNVGDRPVTEHKLAAGRAGEDRRKEDLDGILLAQLLGRSFRLRLAGQLPPEMPVEAEPIRRLAPGEVEVPIVGALRPIATTAAADLAESVIVMAFTKLAHRR